MTAPPTPPGDRQLQRELAKLKGSDPSFGMPSTDDAFAGYLNELERLCNAATPGPWTLDETDWQICGPNGELICDQADVAADLAQADAAFIATARHALPKLIAKVRELQAELDHTDKRLRYETAKDDAERGVAGDRCEVGNECGRIGCPECQQ